MKKALSIVLAVMMLLVLFVGCAPKESSESQSSSASGSESSSAAADAAAGKKIAVCMGSINHPVHRIVQMGFLTKGTELGMAPEVSGLDTGSMQEMLAKWDSAVTNGVEGLLLWVGDDSAYEYMKTWHAAGVKIVIPHFAFNYQDTKDFLDRNISCLAASYGKETADFIVNKLKEKGVTEGTIGITQNGPNVTENAANDSFRAQIAALATNFKLADTVFEGAEVVEAANKVTGVIQANPDIVAGFGTTGGSPQSWATAMENTGKTDLVVVGMDYTELNIGLVVDGKITAVVCQPLFTEAQASAETLYELFNGKVYAEAEWFQELPAPIAFKGGEGDQDIESYLSIVEQVKTFFE